MYKIVFKQTVDRKMMLNTVAYMDCVLILYLKLQHSLEYPIIYLHISICKFGIINIIKYKNVIDKIKKIEAQ